MHALSSNESAIEFYKSAGFYIKEKLLDYYTDLDPPHCYVLEKKLEDDGEEQKKNLRQVRQYLYPSTWPWLEFSNYRCIACEVELSLLHGMT